MTHVLTYLMTSSPNFRLFAVSLPEDAHHRWRAVVAMHGSHGGASASHGSHGVASASHCSAAERYRPGSHGGASALHHIAAERCRHGSHGGASSLHHIAAERCCSTVQVDLVPSIIASSTT